LVNGNYTEAGISVYPILENGKIDSLRQLLSFTEGSVNSDRQEKAHIHSAVFSPNFQTILFADLGADKIRIYPFDSSAIKPLIIDKNNILKTTDESGPRHLTFSKNGKFLYSIEEMVGYLSVYGFSNNIIKPIQRIATHNSKIKEGFESSDVHISPDGKFLYATNRGKENNIAIFKIKEDGTLENIGYQSTYGKHPRTFAISETGKFLIVTNVASNNAVVFKRNIETGMLKKVEKVKIENVSCVKTKMYGNDMK
jgi:6-phosphogluconolactonase